MKVTRWGEASKESWRLGSETLLHASAQTGTERICIGEQWFEPGVGTPLARHAADVEEVISVVEGAAEVQIEGETLIVTAGQAVIIPGGAVHQLVAVNDERLHIWFTLSAPAPVVFLADGSNETMVIGAAEASRVTKAIPGTDA